MASRPIPLPRKSKVVLCVRCQLCGSKPKTIIDAPVMPSGSWAHMCPNCYRQRGRQGMGTTHRNEVDPNWDELGGTPP